VPAGREEGRRAASLLENVPDHGVEVADQPGSSMDRNASAGQETVRYEDLGGTPLVACNG
jgi:hypothetical protein